MDKTTKESRIGFYVCHCGHNIASMVDCPAVAKYVEKLPGVVLSRDYKYMCSDPGQELIQKDIQDFNLNRVVVASCSPLLHEHTFRAATERGGLNPFYFHMVNIREHDSWVHTDRREAKTSPALPSSASPTTGPSRSKRFPSIPMSWWSAAASPASTPP
jgi:heterodisulfide reductase subunit A